MFSLSFFFFFVNVPFQLREDFDCGKETSLEDEQCPHDVATLLKEYLRDLPDPLLCRDLYQAFVNTQSSYIRPLSEYILFNSYIIYLRNKTSKITI